MQVGGLAQTTGGQGVRFKSCQPDRSKQPTDTDHARAISVLATALQAGLVKPAE